MDAETKSGGGRTPQALDSGFPMENHDSDVHKFIEQEEHENVHTTSIDSDISQTTVIDRTEDDQRTDNECLGKSDVLEDRDAGDIPVMNEVVGDDESFRENLENQSMAGEHVPRSDGELEDELPADMTHLGDDGAPIEMQESIAAPEVYEAAQLEVSSEEEETKEIAGKEVPQEGDANEEVGGQAAADVEETRATAADDIIEAPAVPENEDRHTTVEQNTQHTVDERELQATSTVEDTGVETNEEGFEQKQADEEQDSAAEKKSETGAVEEHCVEPTDEEGKPTPAESEEILANGSQMIIEQKVTPKTKATVMSPKKAISRPLDYKAGVTGGEKTKLGTFRYESGPKISALRPDMKFHAPAIVESSKGVPISSEIKAKSAKSDAPKLRKPATSSTASSEPRPFTMRITTRMPPGKDVSATNNVTVRSQTHIISREKPEDSKEKSTEQKSSPPSPGKSPERKVVKSKIGSLDNAKHTPGGGGVKISSQKVDVTKVTSKCGSKDNITHTARGGDKKIESKKLEWKGESKVGSMDNAKHKPSGGEKKIETVKLDFKEKAQAKIGSKDHIDHKAGGGDKKIESRKLDFKDKAQAKVGSKENATHKPGGGNTKIKSQKLDFKEKAKPKVGSRNSPDAPNVDKES